MGALGYAVGYLGVLLAGIGLLITLFKRGDKRLDPRNDDQR